MITETSVRCLLSLTETLSFTKTAKQLFTTQQAVSQQISRLEEDLGVRLFYRDSRRVVLTEQGEMVYRFFWETAQNYQELRARLSSSRSDRFRVLNVGYLRWLEISEADVKTATALQQKYGDQLRLPIYRYSSAELNRQFEAGALDIAITMERWLPAQRSSLTVVPLRRRRIYLYVSPHHPSVRPGAVFEDFSRERFYVDQFEEETLADAVRRCKNDWEPDPNRQVAVVPNRDTVITEVEMGKGVMMGEEYNSRASLLRIPTPHTWETTILFYRKDAENPLAADFAALLRQAYAANEKPAPSQPENETP